MTRSGRHYEDLVQVFRDYRHTDRNQLFIRSFMRGITGGGLEGRSAYFTAHRTDGGRDIQVAPGYTSGFASEQEVLDLLGDVDRWPSSRRGLWGVTHPDAGEGAHRD